MSAQIMDAMKVKKLGLSYQVHELSAKNEKNRRIVFRADKTNKTLVRLRKTLKSKRRQIRVLRNNLAAIKAELETLCLHVYKVDSMLVTTTTSMERVLKVMIFEK